MFLVPRCLFLVPLLLFLVPGIVPCFLCSFCMLRSRPRLDYLLASPLVASLLCIVLYVSTPEPASSGQCPCSLLLAYCSSFFVPVVVPCSVPWFRSLFLVAFLVPFLVSCSGHCSLFRFLFLVPCSLFLVSCSALFLVPLLVSFLVPCSVHCSSFTVPCPLFLTPCPVFLVYCFLFRLLFLVPFFVPFLVPRSLFLVSLFRSLFLVPAHTTITTFILLSSTQQKQQLYCFPAPSKNNMYTASHTQQEQHV